MRDIVSQSPLPAGGERSTSERQQGRRVRGRLDDLNISIDPLVQELVFSRLPGKPKEYVQDRMRTRAADLGALLARATTHIYVCGLRGMEAGVEASFGEICKTNGLDWPKLRAAMRESGRYHVETY